MKYLTKEEYEANAQRNANRGKHWSNFETRWGYHEEAINLVKSLKIDKPHEVLEMGTMGASLVHGSHIIDSGRPWRYKGEKPDYTWDARDIPWPIEDKKYKLFVALRVWHHLGDSQEAALKESLRVSRMALFVTPEHSVKKKGVPLEKYFDWNDGKEPLFCNGLSNKNLLVLVGCA